MRELYFAVYQNLIFKRCFYREQYGLAQKQCFWYTLILIAASVACTMAWSISKTQPVVWAVVIGVCQLAQSFSGVLPCFERREQLKFFMPELDKLDAEMDGEWIRVDLGDYDDHEIARVCENREVLFAELESKYVSDLYFSERKCLIKRATDEKEKYFLARYNYQEGSETNEPDTRQAADAPTSAKGYAATE